MKILIAPDSFKGSASTIEAGNAMEKGVRAVFPHAKIDLIPMADGGEGTMQTLIEASNGTFYETEAQDPLGRLITAGYGVMGNGKTAIIDLASASGITTLTQSELNPCITSTYGTGQLICHALDLGLRHFIICLGGSATNDGGAGILKALGCRFLNSHGNEIEPGGLALRELHDIDMTNIDPRLVEATFQIACDVNNPLVGPNGASAIFGPQKGATPEMVSTLDQALVVYAECIKNKTDKSINDCPGSGAAGGTAAGLMAFLNSELKPGIQLVIEALGFENVIKEGKYDFLLTGEGKIDQQTASGKVVAGLCEIASRYNLPTVAIAGTIEGDLSPLYNKSLLTAFSITEGPITLEQAMENGSSLIKRQTERIFRLLKPFYQEELSS